MALTATYTAHVRTMVLVTGLPAAANVQKVTMGMLVSTVSRQLSSFAPSFTKLQLCIRAV